MSIADKLLIRVNTNRTLIAVVLLSLLVAVAAVGAAPAVAGSDDTETATETTVKATEKPAAATTLHSGPDADFTATNDGTISTFLVLDFGDSGFTNNAPIDDLSMSGTISGDTWTANSASVGDTTINGTSVSLDLSNVGGTYDPDSETFTMDATVTLSAEGESVSFGVSGSGSVDDTGSASVSNTNFAISDSTGNDDLDTRLGLPSDQNSFEVDLNFDVTERGDVQGTVTDEGGDPVSGATVSGAGQEVETDANGEFDLTEVTAGTQELTVSADGYVGETTEVELTDGGTTNTTVELAAGAASLALSVDDVSAATGETLTAAARVENTGTAAGETTVEFTAEGLFDVEETVGVAAGETETVTAEVDVTEDDVGEYTATATAGDVSAEGTIEVTEGSSEPQGTVLSGFQATNTGEGFISFDVTEGVGTAREEGLAFPEDEIEIEGVLYDDGTWEATDVFFPNLEVEAGLEGSVTVPDGFSGEYDLEDDYLSSEALLQVEIIAQGEPQGSFEFTVNTDTGESNGTASEDGLSGSANFEDGEPSGSVTLVDNEYIADDTTGSPIVDPVLGLPVTEPGRNWLELHLEIEPSGTDGQSTGSVAGTVTDENGDPLADATVSVGGESVTTDANGEYEISGVGTGEQTATANAADYSETTTTVEVSEGETTEQDISLEPGEAALNTEISVSDASAGGTVTAEATVTNTGDATGTQTVAFTFDGESKTEEVTVAPGESRTVTAEWTVEEAGEYEVGASVDGQTVARESVNVQDGGEEPDTGDADFVATSTDGFVAFDYPDEQTAREEGVDLPEGIQIAGEVNEEDGTWESTETYFPTFTVDQGLEVAIEAPDGLSGEVDFEEEYLTNEGTLRVTVQDTATFEYEISATTGDSGALSGEASVGQEAEEATVTLVDNEYTIEDQTGDALVDSTLSLPSTESGANWFELELDVNLSGGEIDEKPEETEANDDQSVIRSLGLVGGALALAGALILIAVVVLGRFTGGVSVGSD